LLLSTLSNIPIVQLLIRARTTYSCIAVLFMIANHN